MKNWKQSLAGAFAIAVLMIALTAVVRSPHPLAQAEQNDDPSYYGFLSHYSPNAEAPSPIEGVFNTFSSQEAIAKMQQSTINQFRPFRQWRRWANTSQNPILTFWFVISFSLAMWLIAPSTLRTAEVVYRVNSFQSFLYGAIIVTGFNTLARASMISGIGWPAGIVLIGILLIGLFAGAGIAATSLGKLCSRCVGLDGLHWFVKHSAVLSVIELIAGSLILAACISITGLQSLPPLGTRLVSLLAVTAFGALCKSIRQQASQNPP